jgi:hypothetical protein
MSKVIK